jgi:8-oxo-dGTP pyrophosphatase MutT (NUDIX family)
MAAKPFVLAVSLFIRDPDGRVLLLQRAGCCRHFAGLWETPGGKAEPAESLDSVLQREVQEETALSVEIDGVLGASEFELPQSPCLHVCALYFKGRKIGPAGGEQAGPQGAADSPSRDVRLSGEHQDYRWVWPEELCRRPDLTPALDDMIKRVDLETALGQPASRR